MSEPAPSSGSSSSAGATDLYLAQARSVPTGADLPAKTTVCARGSVSDITDDQKMQIFGHTRGCLEIVMALVSSPTICLHAAGTRAAHVHSDTDWHLHESDCGGFTYRVQPNPATNLALAYTPLDPDSCGIVLQYLGDGGSIAAMMATPHLLLPFTLSWKGAYECMATTASKLQRISWAQHTLYDELCVRALAEVRQHLRLQWMMHDGRMRDVSDAELHLHLDSPLLRTRTHDEVQDLTFFPIVHVRVQVKPERTNHRIQLPTNYVTTRMRALPPGLAVTPLADAVQLKLSFAFWISGDGIVTLLNQTVEDIEARFDRATRGHR